MLLRIKSKETGVLGLAKLLSLKMGAKSMLTVNLNIQDHLIKSQTGSIIIYIHEGYNKGFFLLTSYVALDYDFE